ncbi:MAG TPA: glycosyltransferase [Steroidobacteraceae bacterium]
MALEIRTEAVAASPAMGTPLAILHVTAPSEYGGLERVIGMLARGHARQGHHVHIAALLPGFRGRHPFVDGFSDSSVLVHPIATHARNYPAQMRAIEALCRRVGPAVLHTHGYQADILAGRVARRLNIPVVSTVHGFTGGDWKNRLYEQLQCRALRRFSRVIAVSRPLVTRLREAHVPAESIVMLPNAWEDHGSAESREQARAQLGIPDNIFHIGWVGRISHEKGLDVLIEALDFLSEVPLILSVIGDGAEQKRVQAFANRLGVAGRIRWHGARDEAWRVFPALDAFVLSSRTEGTPIVLFEAMAAGVPVIATMVGGVPDVVSQSEAWLVPPEDPQALAHAIHQVHRAPAVAEARARAARHRLATRFGIDNWLKQYEDMYRSL